MRRSARGRFGHHKASVTLDTYIHLLPEEMPEADFPDDLTGASEVPARPDETDRDLTRVAALIFLQNSDGPRQAEIPGRFS